MSAVTQLWRRQMNTIGKFEKVSFDEYYKAIKPLLPGDWTDEEIKQSWEDIELPTRATSGSAGYDFRAPVGFSVDWTKPIVVPTGIRARIADGWFLMCAPRSRLGLSMACRWRTPSELSTRITTTPTTRGTSWRRYAQILWWKSNMARSLCRASFCRSVLRKATM